MLLSLVFFYEENISELSLLMSKKEVLLLLKTPNKSMGEMPLQKSKICSKSTSVCPFFVY